MLGSEPGAANRRVGSNPTGGTEPVGNTDRFNYGKLCKLDKQLGWKPGVSGDRHVGSSPILSAL